MNTTPQDVQKGRELLSIYHSNSVGYSKYPFKSSLELENYLGGIIFADSLGFTANALVNVNGASPTRLNAGIQNLASQGQGRLPSNKTTFFTALGNAAQNYSFLDAVSYTAVESAKDIGKGAVVVGETAIATGKILLGVGPILLVGGIIAYVYFRVKK